VPSSGSVPLRTSKNGLSAAGTELRHCSLPEFSTTDACFSIRLALSKMRAVAAYAVFGTAPGGKVMENTYKAKLGVTLPVRMAILGALIGMGAPGADGQSLARLTTDALTLTTTTISSSVPSAAYGENIPFVALVSNTSGTTATGTVTFYDRDGAPVPQPAPVVGTATLVNGSASVYLNSLSTGSHLIFATYAGNTVFASSSSALLGFTVNPVPVSAYVTASPNPSAPGQAVTFTATITPPFSGTPSGSVTFKDGTSTLGSATLSGGQAGFTTSTLALGTHSISVVYSGDSNFTGTTSTVVTQTVKNAQPVATQTMITSFVNPTLVTQPTNFTVTVSASGSGTPTGTVTIKDGTATLTMLTLGNGTATDMSQSLTAGAHSITAVYSGDSNFTGSTSAPLVENVYSSNAATTVSLVSSANPSTPGQSVTFTATVNTSGPGTPTGFVTFWDGTTELTSFALNGKSVSLTTSTLSLGSHSITAGYGGDLVFSPSTSAVLNQVVSAAPTATSTAVVSSLNPSTAGQPVTFTAIVTASGSGSPSGSVTFKDGGSTLASSPLSNARAGFTTSTLSSGPHSITAVYSGDSNFAGSTSSVLSQTVMAATVPLAFSCGAAGSPQVGANYSLTCTASGGLSPYTFSVSAGTLPSGLGLLSTGVTVSVAGSPAVAGSYSFTLQAADSSTPALTATQSFSGTVTGAASVLSISPAAGLSFTAYQGRGNPASQTLSVTSTSGSTNFTVTNIPAWVQVTPSSGATPATITVTAAAGALPAGLTSGSITIAPASGQAVSVNVQANVAAFSIGAAGPVNETVAAGATKNDSLAVTTVDNGPASVQATAATTSGANWLKLSSATLSAPGPLAFTIDATSLSAGNYAGTITLSCATANPCGPVAVAVNLTVGAPTVTIAQLLNDTGEAAFISQNTWIEIKGTNLSQTTRTWQSSDFDPQTGLMPTQLDGVSATVNGKPAYVYYISPTQINVLTPLDSALGTVGVQVMNSMGTSAVASVAMLENSLGFFAFESAKYAVAEHTNGTLLGPTSLYPGQTTPAAPGETIVLYGNGFGQTNPPITLGLAVQQGLLPDNPAVTIGGLPANVIYAAVISPGLYQFNVVVPTNAPAGDLTLLATYNGVSTQSGVVITVAQ
jgi:uncharacterized protein (TIGR03437 family)